MLDLVKRSATVQRTLALADEGTCAITHFRAKELKPSRAGRLIALLPELEVAYKRCHSQRVIHRKGRLGWWDGMPHELRKWSSLATSSRIPEFVRYAKTIKRNGEGILNS